MMRAGDRLRNLADNDVLDSLTDDLFHRYYTHGDTGARLPSKSVWPGLP